MRNITATNKKKIDEVLNKVQEKAKTRCFSSDVVSDAINMFEGRLKLLGIKKADWIGCTIKICHTVTHSYKYYAEGTIIEISKIACGWTVTDIRRGGIPKRSEEGCDYICTMSEAAKSSIPTTVIF